MFDVRYAKANFEIEFINDCKLPKYKTSSLRGGMGTMLMGSNCTSNGKCNECDSNKDCIVKNIMYSNLKNELSFIKDKTIAPYIIECFDEREHYKRGDKLKFNIILFGDTISYMVNIIYCFDLLGKLGKGFSKYHYILTSVYNEENEKIYDGFFLKDENIYGNTILSYIDKRKREIDRINTIEFITPFRLKRNGRYKDSLTFDDFMFSISRRLMILNAFEGNYIDDIEWSRELQLMSSNLTWLDINRYSNRQKESMKLGGVKGEIEFPESINEYMDYIIAGELVHVGKNTAFGLGKYNIL